MTRKSFHRPRDDRLVIPVLGGGQDYLIFTQFFPILSEHRTDYAKEVERTGEALLQRVFVGEEELADSRDVLEGLVYIELDHFQLTVHLVADSEYEGFLTFVHLVELWQQYRRVLFVFVAKQYKESLQLIAQRYVTIIVNFGLVAHLLQRLEYQFFLIHRRHYFR